MRRLSAVLVVVCAITAASGTKETGTTILKDLQPAGTPGNEGKKNKKTKQQFDFSFDSTGRRYTCRTDEKTTVDATNFVVGTALSYQIDGSKGKTEKRRKRSQVHSGARRERHASRELRENLLH